MKTHNEIKQILQAQKPYLAEQYGINEIGVFGSYVRGEQRPDSDLTAHEKRLLKLLVEGRNFKSIAPQLGVTVHAVSFHMRRIYEKLQVHSKSEAVAKALRDRLV